VLPLESQPPIGAGARTAPACPRPSLGGRERARSCHRGAVPAQPVAWWPSSVGRSLRTQPIARSRGPGQGAAPAAQRGRTTLTWSAAQGDWAECEGAERPLASPRELVSPPLANSRRREGSPSPGAAPRDTLLTRRGSSSIHRPTRVGPLPTRNDRANVRFQLNQHTLFPLFQALPGAICEASHSGQERILTPVPSSGRILTGDKTAIAVERSRRGRGK